MGGGLGRRVFHCHIFFHAVFGMISEFDVVAPQTVTSGLTSTNTPTPPRSTKVRRPSATGTFKDPDGDSVTLSASIGTVTDLGSGQWSWSYTTKDGPAESQVVAITAKDSNGNQGQTSFKLHGQQRRADRQHHKPGRESAVPACGLRSRLRQLHRSRHARHAHLPNRMG